VSLKAKSQKPKT